MDTLKTKHGDVHVCATEQELADRTARELIAVVKQAMADRGRATIALSGGSTPHILYRRLLESDLKSAVDWTKAHFFMGDERCVPADDKESNWGNAWRMFLCHLDLPADNLHTMVHQDTQPEQCALEYEAHMRKFFGLSQDQIPAFDLIHLGMGPDGHCASLFPDSKALTQAQRLVVDNWVEKLSSKRITFTFPLINHAHNIMFMIEGENKSQVLMEALSDVSAILYPVQHIMPLYGRVDWYVDQSAAKRLKVTSAG